MNLDEWTKQVDEALKAASSKVRSRHIEVEDLVKGFEDGESPVVFAMKVKYHEIPKSDSSDDFEEERDTPTNPKVLRVGLLILAWYWSVEAVYGLYTALKPKDHTEPLSSVADDLLFTLSIGRLSVALAFFFLAWLTTAVYKIASK